MNVFDYCIITASSQKQAENFERLIKSRINHGLYPREIQFRVLADPPNGRIGNGGSTLLVLHSLFQESTFNNPIEYFQQKKVLIIHAGGESRRLPCFAPEGKLFAPVPVDSSSILPPVLLDLQLNLFFRYPWKKGEVLIASGDVVIDFNVDLVPNDRGDICGFAKPVSLDFGSRHGVFVFDKDQKTVVDFLQKAPPEVLAKRAVIEGTSECAIDTGLISLSPEFVGAFFEFSKLIVSNDLTVLNAFKQSTYSFSIYLELLTSCVKDITFAEFKRRVISKASLDESLLKEFHTAFKRYPLYGVQTSSTTFIHFGSLHEFPRACEEIIHKELKPFYAQLNEELKIINAQSVIAYNSLSINIPVKNREIIVIEESANCDISRARGNNVLIGLNDWTNDIEIPEDICIDSRNLDGSTIQLVYSIHDTFSKEQELTKIRFCGSSMDQWLHNRGLAEKDIWHKNNKYDLLAAELYSTGFTEDFLEGFWNKPTDSKWSETFRKANRLSIQYLNDQEDVTSREDRRIEMRKHSLKINIINQIGWKSISSGDFKKTFRDKKQFKQLRDIYKKTDDALLSAYRGTLMSSLMDLSEEDFIEPHFGIEYSGDTVSPESLIIGIKTDQIVWARSPVRLDLAGGWSDTPPHALRLGGQVVNFAADLNGQPPIQVFCRRTEEMHVRIHSIDIGITETVKTFDKLEDYRNLGSPFVLPKAALCLLGFTKNRFHNSPLEQVLSRLGCGIEITLLCAVPKGSGLGTSSILGAVILAALQRIFGLDENRERLFWQVLKLEQMLTTGGGWQDQIGGVVGGVKYIETKPGYKPYFLIHQLDTFLFSDKECLRCFTLFYTGFTRLAKNILKDVVYQANSNTPAYIFTLKYLKQLAVDAKDAILSRDLECLAEIISYSWEENKKIHYSTSNEVIEQMFEDTQGFYKGAKLLGAGGGGYALFLSENPEQAEKLRLIINKKYVNDKARIVNMTLNTEGLQVSVS